MIVDCQGKPNLLGAVDRIITANFPPFTGVYDTDFDRLNGKRHHPTVLATTDQNDLELSLVASEALDEFLREFGDAKKIADFEQENQLSVLEHLQTTSQEFGQLRYLNEKLGLNVQFERLSPYRFVSEDTWMLDRPSLISEYARLSQLSASDVEAFVQSHCPARSRWAMSQGHDTISILRVGLRKRIGKTQISDSDILKVLRIAYPDKTLYQSQMYYDLRAIEAKLPVKIF